MQSSDLVSVAEDGVPLNDDPATNHVLSFSSAQIDNLLSFLARVSRRGTGYSKVPNNNKFTNHSKWLCT